MSPSERCAHRRKFAPAPLVRSLARPPSPSRREGKSGPLRPLAKSGDESGGNKYLRPPPGTGRIILLNPVHGEGARIQAPERDGAVVERVRLEV